MVVVEHVRTQIWVVVSMIFYFHPYKLEMIQFEKYFFRWVETINQKFSWENLWSRPTLCYICLGWRGDVGMHGLEV